MYIIAVVASVALFISYLLHILAESATTVTEYRFPQSSICRMLCCEIEVPWPMNSIWNPISSSSEKLCLSFNKTESFTYELWLSINTIGIHRNVRWNRLLSHTAYFSSFVPLTARTHKAVPLPHRLEFIYGGKSIEERHISICFLTPFGRVVCVLI